MKYLIPVLLGCLFMAIPASGQKLLQLEKAGTLKTKRFYIGDELTFQLKNDDTGWHTRTINDIDVDNNTLVFYNYRLHIDSIAVIQLQRKNTLNIIGAALQLGGINTILFSAGFSIFQNNPIDWVAIGSGAAISIIGTLLRQFKTKQFKVGARKRLRVLDLNFGPVLTAPPPPSKS